VTMRLTIRIIMPCFVSVIRARLPAAALGRMKRRRPEAIGITRDDICAQVALGADRSPPPRCEGAARDTSSGISIRLKTVPSSGSTSNPVDLTTVEHTEISV